MDSYAKWLQVQGLPSSASKSIARVLRGIFATLGLDVELVSDNGTSFRSHEFRDFLKSNGIKYTLIPPYGTLSNRQAASYVETEKNFL